MVYILLFFLEENGLFSGLNRLLDWVGPEKYENRSTLNIVDGLKLLAKGKINLIWRRLAYPKKRPSKKFLKSFREKNKWDYKLFTELRERNLNKF